MQAFTATYDDVQKPVVVADHGHVGFVSSGILGVFATVLLVNHSPMGQRTVSLAFLEGVRLCHVIEGGVMSTVMERYHLPSKRSAVDFALRQLLVVPMSRDEVLAMRGSGFELTNSEIEGDWRMDG